MFIFVALRALRFEALYVILAGGLAALGWLVMTVYAVYATGPEMITRDYVYYMTSNSILIGAEFDKIASILVVTAILATAVTRSRLLAPRGEFGAIAPHPRIDLFPPPAGRGEAPPR